jgi:light-regulated signal transduction histidine kinase (bacteriophytochrome)
LFPNDRNAIKYNDKDKISVEIGYTENDIEFQFYIKTTELVFLKKYHSKVLIFSKLENNDSSPGIGLSIVKKL